MDFGLSSLVGSTILGGLGGKVIDKIMKPKTPQVAKPTVMPMADDEATKAARRRQIAEVQSRSGRASTILSDSDKLGG